MTRLALARRRKTFAAATFAGVIAAGSLSGCQQSDMTASDAQSLSASFCSTWLPAVQPVIGQFNAQIRKDFATAANACAAIGDGRAVDAVTVAVAALSLYEGVKATYPKLAGLSPRDVGTAHRLIDGARLGAYLGAR